MEQKLTIVHGVYRRNPYILETLAQNLLALRVARIENYQYIIFNDNGDKEIEEDLSDYKDEIEYIYSPKNFGNKVCRGSWVGALPYVNGDLLHVTDQDDPMTPTFYTTSMDIFRKNPNIDLVFHNCIMMSDDSKVLSFGMNPNINPGVNWPSYDNPLECFKHWFGVEDSKVTRANNHMMASGVIYRTKLHEIVGEPDMSFGGACDFEYWTRILFNERKCKMVNLPTWFYRLSEYSAGNTIVDGEKNNDKYLHECIDNIKVKYAKLWEEKYNETKR